ncbi:GNAT family N-acetyltransferase [Actinacidiphila guanduensis]|uniref:Ribosomal protein S18 acetylase RimI n=1 Tax=Actinacidiphila guanduensis TaxID=310781 RepID=A0A1G9V561_9ACTN|nr:N-acetyltransferase [Actinacidiphila guanduensis]SDM67253.1 Ribosomal protein S18 acetylase RimI [Actinacidiphila guanduensis]
MDSDVEVRPARAGDLAACGSLAADHSGGSAGTWARAFGSLLVPGPHALFTAAEDGGTGRVVGYGKVHRFTPPLGGPPDTAPEGFYLSGLAVAPDHRHRGVGTALVRVRTAWVTGRAPCVWYFANARNTASLRLHQGLGFTEVTRDFSYPGVEFDGGVGVLCRAWLDGAGRA